MATIESWIERLSKKEMPAFGSTAQEISRLATDDSQSTNLANVILRDAGMTARVLKMANSAYYSGGHHLATVSRAITILGVNSIQKMCIGVALIDSLTKDRPRLQLTREMERSFYAATLAKSLAIVRKDPDPEEVFIAALLYHVGEMAFWCFGSRYADEVEDLVRSGLEPKAAQKQVVGFHLKQLSVALQREWKLGELLAIALRADPGRSVRAQSIILAHEFALSLSGPAPEEAKDYFLQLMSAHSGAEPTIIEELIQVNLQEAKRVANLFDATLDFDELLRGHRSISGTLPAITDETVPVPAAHAKSDPLLQLKILNEMLTMTRFSPNVESMIQLALEGIYRGIGTDRAAFLMINEDSQSFGIRLALGIDAEELMTFKDINLKEDSLGSFLRALRRKIPVWAQHLSTDERNNFPEAFVKLVGNGDFFVAPITFKQRVLGFAFADRQPTKRPLEPDDFESFQLFVQQLSVALEITAK